ncbi:MAG TPA: molybdate ABC transporter permease subunit, partial [Bacteroidota bacterium]|nr:molybdate ABC transporter permease subunit [Bacteroidota bacterium]
MNDARLRLPLAAAALPLVSFLVLPLAGLLLRASGEDILGTFLGPEAARAVALSVTTTLITVLIAVAFGTPAAYLIARKKFPGK